MLAFLRRSAFIGTGARTSASPRFQFVAKSTPTAAFHDGACHRCAALARVQGRRFPHAAATRSYATATAAAGNDDDGDELDDPLDEAVEDVDFDASPPPPPAPLAMPDGSAVPPNLHLDELSADVLDEDETPFRYAPDDGGVKAVPVVRFGGGGGREDADAAADAATDADGDDAFDADRDDAFDDADVVGEVVLSNAVFGEPVRLDLLHEVVRWQARKPWVRQKHMKFKWTVSGSNRKVRPQKGTGRARAGHGRPPHWRGGARAFPRQEPRAMAVKVNKKVRRKAMRSALAAKWQEGRVHVVDGAAGALGGSHRTRDLVALLRSHAWWRAHGERPTDRRARKRFRQRRTARVLLVTAEDELPEHWELAARNLAPELHALPSVGANVRSLLGAKAVVCTPGGLEELCARLTRRELAHLPGTPEYALRKAQTQVVLRA